MSQAHTITGAQAIYDEAVIHLAGMQFRCMKEGICAYRDEDGDGACAAGHFMTDAEVYRDGELLSGTVYSLNQSGHLPKRLADHLHLIGDLQNVHDEDENWDPEGGHRHRMITALIGVGASRGLDTSNVAKAFPTPFI